MDVGLGRHWIFDAWDIQTARLREADFIRELLSALPTRLELTMVSEPQVFEHDDGERSVAGIVLLAESHFSLHVFPERGACHGDLFSCKAFDLEVARGFVLAQLGVPSLDERVLDRCVPGSSLSPSGS